MNLPIILALFLNFICIKSFNLRNLLLGRDNERYAVLIEAAKKSFYQIYNITIDFRDRYEVIVDDDKKRLRVIVDDEYSPLIPETNSNITFKVVNGEPQLAEILTALKQLDNDAIKSVADINIFGNNFNVREEFKNLANMIAAGFDYGEVIIYPLINENTAQVRYKCFITNQAGDEYGSFEIIQEDKNDKSEVNTQKKSWFDKIKGWIKDSKEVIENVGGVVTAITGIIETCKNTYDKLNPKTDNKTAYASYIKGSSLVIMSSLALL